MYGCSYNTIFITRTSVRLYNFINEMTVGNVQFIIVMRVTRITILEYLHIIIILITRRVVILSTELNNTE